MRRIVVTILLSTLLGMFLTAFISILEITRLFTIFKTLNDNLFIVGILYFVLSLFSMTNSKETGKGMAIYSNTIKYEHQEENEDIGRYKKFALFLIVGVLFIAVGIVLPTIKLI